MKQYLSSGAESQVGLRDGFRRLIVGFGVQAMLFSGLWLADRARPRPEKAVSPARLTILRLPALTTAKPAPLAASLPLPRVPRKAILPAPAKPLSATTGLPSPPELVSESRPATPPPALPAIAGPTPAFENRIVEAPVRRQAPVVGSFGGPQPVSSPERQRPVLEETAGFSASTARPSQEQRNRKEVLVGALAASDSTQRSRPMKQTAEVIEFAGTASAPRPPREVAAIAMGGFEQRWSAEVPVARKPITEGTFEPVEILSKPKPQYTEAARRLGIEGEVALRILFGTDGKLKVLTILQGLGYGLDENAASAAARIEFRPARRNGQPVEQAAVVRVRFHLAQ